MMIKSRLIWTYRLQPSKIWHDGKCCHNSSQQLQLSRLSRTYCPILVPGGQRMSTVTSKPRTEDAISLIEGEICRADQERTPISRQTLAQLVNQKTGLPSADAVALVDEFCEERAPGVPYYLQEEFAIPYLK